MPTALVSRINGLLAEIASQGDVEGLELDEGGMCQIELKDKRRIGFALDERREQLWLFTGLFSFPEEDMDARSVLYERMLSANLLLVGSEGGMLALDPVEDRAIFQLSLNASTVDTGEIGRGISALVMRAESITDSLLRADIAEQHSPT